MGEYAIRKSDGADVKIGTCEDMYYLRFEDRDKVRHKSGNVNPSLNKEAGQLRFRLPFPDEDHKQPGEYDDPFRSVALYCYRPCEWCKGEPKTPECYHCKGSGHEPYAEWYSDPKLLETPGTMQLHHSGGLLLNVPCYHGLKLPDVGADAKAFWNGKSQALVLSSLRAINNDHNGLDVFPVIRCLWCREAWRCEWADVWDYIPADIRGRFNQYLPGECPGCDKCKVTA